MAVSTDNLSSHELKSHFFSTLTADKCFHIYKEQANRVTLGEPKQLITF